MSLLAEGPRKAHRRAGMPIVDQKGATVKSFATGVIKLLTMRYEESVAVVDTILSNINHLDNFVGKLPGFSSGRQPFESARRSYSLS
jgi:hypothetical protein